MNGYRVLILVVLLATSCSEAPDKRVRKEPIRRLSSQATFALNAPSQNSPPLYTWDAAYSELAPITKEHLRCKGDPKHPIRHETIQDKEERLQDCIGGTRHSLPIHEGEEIEYPGLLELLNYLQSKTERRLVITCGHRCPDHHKYAEPLTGQTSSKHLVGAEVDFYIEGYEENPQAIVDLIFTYYREHPELSKKTKYTQFERYTKPDTNVRTQPWFNKEVFVKMFAADEGRDFDNAHHHPYIGIMLRYDRARKQTVRYSWNQAYRGYYLW